MFISIGNQVANLTSYYFSKHRPSRGWRWMLATGAVPSVLLVFGIFALPESPQWLVMRGRLRDAKRILAKTSRSEEEAALRFADIKKAAGIPEEFDDDVYTIADQDTGVWRDILHPTWSMVHMLLCAVGIQVVQQACGMDTLALFSPKVLETVGITTSVGKLLANMVLDIAKILVFLLASYLADWVGRRPLLLSSMGGVFLSLMFVGLFLTLKVSWAVEVSAILYVIFFSIGLGPITDVYCTEIIPLRMRAQVYTIGLGVKQGVSVILSYTYLLMFKAIKLGGAAFLFGGFAIVSCVLFYILMPETRGKTLDEIGQLFGRLRRTAAANDVELQRTEAAVSSE
ncbi:polyol transporter 5-like [Syzygium oleosum]|uniref:polyol transporter 5-like n=1 Tax=Syzygium oleosum TaxID=219896 RepID=UPI0024BB5CAD|nr:polyol transporter 5-like [Syzygium oleosum]